MPLTDRRTGSARPAALTEWAGYVGIAPLLLCLPAVGLLPDYGARELAQRIALAWGAMLLASSGAVHIGLALAGRLSWHPGRLVAALLPAVFGALAVVIGGQRGLAVLVVGCGGFGLYEHRALAEELPAGYLSLRRQLTLATGILLAVTMFVSDAAGLS